MRIHLIIIRRTNMGIGFVLFVLLVLLMGVALIASVVLGLFTSWFLRQAQRGPRIRAVLMTVAFPPVAVVSAFVGFFGYWIWCETARGVDAGIGDYWRVPLGSGYTLLMIDTTDQACVESPNGEQAGHHLRRLGFDDKVVYFETELGKFVLVEKATGVSHAFDTQSALDDTLRQLGSMPSALQRPADAYQSLRWSCQDLIVVPLVLGVPAVLSLYVAVYVWRIRQRTVIQPQLHGA